MPAAFVIHSSPAEAAGAQDYIDFLNTLHRAELHREIPELASYTVYLDLPREGALPGITVVGVAPALSAAELAGRLSAGLPRLTPYPTAPGPTDGSNVHIADLTPASPG